MLFWRVLHRMSVGSEHRSSAEMLHQDQNRQLPLATGLGYMEPKMCQYLQIGGGANHVRVYNIVTWESLMAHNGQIAPTDHGHGGSELIHNKHTAGLSFRGAQPGRIEHPQCLNGVGWDFSRGAMNPNNGDKKPVTGWTFWNIGCLRLSSNWR